MKTPVPFIGAVALFVINATTVFSAENPIAIENRKVGSTNWLLFNFDQVMAPGRDELWKREKSVEGYCSHPSIKAGETLRVFVSTEPAAPFKIDFYRLGYYGGKGGRLVHSTSEIKGKTQPTPEDGKKALIECRWNVSYELKIPQDWPSGVYLGKLQVAEPKAEAYVIFIVRDERKADLLFQCSDMTWQSYNRWPAWRSLYDYQTNRWHTSAGNDVGFDRPYGIYLNWLPANYFPISNGSGEFLLWEFPLAFWLEKEGYDVSYI
ncbi:MAG TPA: N,N-dimethylformamidase beta subunit family domain-containing protein, partial [Candidatus Eisenbacteria bacterium]|nr:N,N-dimethylformamidase beta subunit family domain-containing protein [Candidatus Eisenbacteria bacterium]